MALVIHRWQMRALREDIERAVFQKVQPIDPNADMLQKDSAGALDQAIKQLASIGQQQPKRRDPDAPREPGESLGIVAPMDGRLGRFREAV